MRALVGSFNVNGGKIVILEYFQGGGKLVFIVCILFAGRALGANKAQSRKCGNAVAKRNSRNNNAVVAGLLLEIGQLYSRALCPEPHAVCRHFALGAQLFVERMMLKNAVCRLHKIAQDICVFAAGGQYRTDLLAEVIVRRSKADAFYIGLRLHGDVAEGVAEVHLHARFLGKRRKLGIVKQRGDYRVGHLAVNGSCRVRKDALFLKGHVALLIGDHVAAIGNVACIELYAGRRGFKRCASRVVKVRVAAENGHYRRIASGRQAARNVQHAADLAVRGKLVDKRFFCIFKRSQAAELGNGVIGHTVSYYKNVFHLLSLLALEYEIL